MPPIRLQVRWRRFEIALEDIVRDPNPQRHTANRELLTRSIAPGARGHVSDILCVLVLRRAVRVHVCGNEHVLGRKGVEAPVHTQEDAAQRRVEHAVPDAVEVPWVQSAHVAELVGDGLRGDVVVVEIAADAVEFVGDEVEGDVVGGVVREGEVVTALVVQPGDLEGGADEGGVAGWVGGEGRFEVEMVAVGVGGAFGEPERVCNVRGIESDAGQGAPELEAVLLLPGEDAGVGQGGVEEGEDAHKVGVGRLVGGSGDLAVPGDVAQALVEDARGRAEEVGAVVGPGEARHCL